MRSTFSEDLVVFKKLKCNFKNLLLKNPDCTWAIVLQQVDFFEYFCKQYWSTSSSAKVLNSIKGEKPRTLCQNLFQNFWKNLPGPLKMVREKLQISIILNDTQKLKLLDVQTGHLETFEKLGFSEKITLVTCG